MLILNYLAQLEGLRVMIMISEEYANEHSIIFYGSKSKYLAFENYKYNPTIQVKKKNVSNFISALSFEAYFIN